MAGGAPSLSLADADVPPPGSASAVRIRPRIIIHGGAGNIRRDLLPADKYEEYRSALLAAVRDTDRYMSAAEKHGHRSALDIACHAVVLLEDNALFNSAHGAVFTRDGVNELEASVAVSRGAAKRCVGVAGLRRVRNPILLAKRILERGDRDLASLPSRPPAYSGDDGGLDVPSAQGHTVVSGRAAEQLARDYGLALVDPRYFFTQQRWDEHVAGLRRERRARGSATWAADAFLPQGTCGAVALDGDGVVCVATSTGGMTNKLTGRVGDTPVPGAGFWAEEWAEPARAAAGPRLALSGPLRALLADCLPTPFLRAPAPRACTTATRALGVSGTGNGDSFLRTCAAHSVAALSRHAPQPAARAVRAVVGPGGELQRSAGLRWPRTGEGEGGMIGVECVVERDVAGGRVVRARSAVVMDFNCAGMYRAWIDDEGRAVMSVWTNGASDRDPPS